MEKSPNWKHVVLICRPGHAGAVAALPVALTVKTYWPDCRVTCVVGETTGDILKDQPAVDTVLCDPGFMSLLRLFRRLAPTRAIFFAPCPTGLLAALIARISTQIASDTGILRSLMRHLLIGLSRSIPCFDRVALPRMLRSLGLPPQLPGRPWVVLTPREKRRAHRRLCHVLRPRVLVHPSALTGSLGLLDSRWNLVLAGLGARDSARQFLAQWVERGARNLLDELSLREWLAILVECDVFVSADDESIMFADAMGIPTVRLDPPSVSGESVPVLPEAVMWQVEAVFRHRLRVVGRRVGGPTRESFEAAM
jgi:hypothetical protein